MGITSVRVNVVPSIEEIRTGYGVLASHELFRLERPILGVDPASQPSILPRQQGSNITPRLLGRGRGYSTHTLRTRNAAPSAALNWRDTSSS